MRQTSTLWLVLMSDPHLFRGKEDTGADTDRINPGFFVEDASDVLSRKFPCTADVRGEAWRSMEPGIQDKNPVGRILRWNWRR